MVTETAPTAAAVELTSTADPHGDVTVTKVLLTPAAGAELLD